MYEREIKEEAKDNRATFKLRSRKITDNAMAQKKKTYRQTILHKTRHKILMTKPHEPDIKNWFSGGEYKLSPFYNKLYICIHLLFNIFQSANEQLAEEIEHDPWNDQQTVPHKKPLNAAPGEYPSPRKKCK